jgi:hypothetical protein
VPPSVELRTHTEQDAWKRVVWGSLTRYVSEWVLALPSLIPKHSLDISAPQIIHIEHITNWSCAATWQICASKQWIAVNKSYLLPPLGSSAGAQRTHQIYVMFHQHASKHSRVRALSSLHPLNFLRLRFCWAINGNGIAWLEKNMCPNSTRMWNRSPDTTTYQRIQSSKHCFQYSFSTWETYRQIFWRKWPALLKTLFRDGGKLTLQRSGIHQFFFR